MYVITCNAVSAYESSKKIQEELQELRDAASADPAYGNLLTCVLWVLIQSLRPIPLHPPVLKVLGQPFLG